MFKKIKNVYANANLKIGAALNAPTKTQTQVVLFLIGVGLLSGGITEMASAASGSNGQGALTLEYNDTRLTQAVNLVLSYIEGSFGAMVMVVAGLSAIISSALGQYKAALGLLIVAVGAFILRSLIGAFFNDANIQE